MDALDRVNFLPSNLFASFLCSPSLVLKILYGPSHPRKSPYSFCMEFHIPCQQIVQGCVCFWGWTTMLRRVPWGLRAVETPCFLNTRMTRSETPSAYGMISAGGLNAGRVLFGCFSILLHSVQSQSWTTTRGKSLLYSLFLLYLVCLLFDTGVFFVVECSNDSQWRGWWEENCRYWLVCVGFL